METGGQDKAGTQVASPEVPVIEAVVFDLGNVLIGWDPTRVWADTMSGEEIEEFFAAVDFPRFNHSLDAGRTWAQARAELAELAPEYVGHVDTYLEAFDRSLTGPIPGSADIVTDLKAAGIRVLGLTNWSAETFHHAPVAAPVLTELEAILVSGEVGLAKPDPEIFRLLITRYDLDPARTVFIDDVAKNVAAAAALGFHAILFSDAPTFRADLQALGVPIL